MLVNRLPYGLKLKWRDVADRITKTEEREITIEDIDNFVTSKAHAAIHAIFGNVTKDNPVPPKGTKFRNKSPPKVSNFAIDAGSQQESHTPVNGNQKCPLCNAQHWLSHCDKFKKKSLRDRFNFVCSKNICDNCLVPGHFSNSCPKESFCHVTGCMSTPNTPPSCIQRIMDQLLISLPEPAEPVLQGLHSKWTIRGFTMALSMEEMKL